MNILDKLYSNRKQRVASRFVFLFGPLIGGCSKVKNIKKKMDRELYHEGGLNRKPVVLASPQKKLEQLVLEKGYIKFNPSMLILSAESILDMHIFSPGTLMIMKNSYLPSRMFIFEEGIISEWSMVDLDAKSPELTLDSITIEHSGLVEVPVSLDLF